MACSSTGSAADYRVVAVMASGGGGCYLQVVKGNRGEG